MTSGKVVVVLNQGRMKHGQQSSKRMKRMRSNHTPGFKAQVALAAIRRDKALAELAEYFQMRATKISEWKQQLAASAARIFGRVPRAKAAEPDLKVHHAKIWTTYAGE